VWGEEDVIPEREGHADLTYLQMVERGAKPKTKYSLGQAWEYWRGAGEGYLVPFPSGCHP